MVEKIEEVKKAKAQIVGGSLTIWNARLDALQRAGDIKGALEQMVSPVEAQGNGGCDCGCSFLPGIDVSLPEKLGKSKRR